ncbi:hypothetical protein AB1L42_15365 [Thalassoglobus sp. JC818]|uniref:hypothetical protein n=1 Tax=Thalassoglobus sp. JC818 TaxID=3232136 RepID=UPI00345918DE
MAADNDPKRRQLDEFYASYTVFVGVLCFAALFLFGWEIILTWIFFRSGMRLFLDVMTDSPVSRPPPTQQKRRCRD